MSINTDQRHFPCRAHPSASTVPRCTGLPLLVGVPRPEPHRIHRKFLGQVPIRDVVRFAPPLPGEVWPFLNLAICTLKRDAKSQPKAQGCYNVPGSTQRLPPRDCMRVLTTHRSILTTRNVTWQHVPSAPSAPQQQLPPVAEKEESTAREGASGESASSRGRWSVEDLDSETDLNMTEVWPTVPPTMREAPAAEPGARAGGRCRRQAPDTIGLPREGRFQWH